MDLTETSVLKKYSDPFGQFSDEAIWNALRQVELADFISSTDNKLDYFLEERGQNFSVGQKQLICLARALLKKNKILVIDEATANVDPRTDNLIQKTIRTEFKECTVITIAHRLNTIIDSDRIGVMSNGKILEIDSPKNLLSNPESAFYGIVQESKDRAALMIEAGARVNTISPSEHARSEEQTKSDRKHKE